MSAPRKWDLLIMSAHSPLRANHNWRPGLDIARRVPDKRHLGEELWPWADVDCGRIGHQGPQSDANCDAAIVFQRLHDSSGGEQRSVIHLQRHAGPVSEALQQPFPDAIELWLGSLDGQLIHRR